MKAWREVWAEVRQIIADLLIGFALRVMPDVPRRKVLAVFVYSYMREAAEEIVRAQEKRS